MQDFIHFLQSNPSESALAERFDINGFIKAQAAEIVMGAVDHYVRVGNNYYLYFNPTTDYGPTLLMTSILSSGIVTTMVAVS